MSKNNTYDIDNGYIFSDVKKGNFYQISGFKQERITRLDNDQDNFMSAIILNLDTESKHFESNVYQIMDSIGTIGGIFELLLGVLLILYGKIRKSLYYYSIIGELNSMKKYHNDHKDDIKGSETSRPPLNVASREELKKLNQENNRLLNNLSNDEIKHDPNNRLKNYFQGQIEQIRKRGVVNRQHEIDIIHQICGDI